MTSKDSKTKKREQFIKLRDVHLQSVEPSIRKQVFNFLQHLVTSGSINGHIGVYWPLKGEVDIRSIKSLVEIPIALPAVTEEGKLIYYPWENNSLEKDYVGIPAPVNETPLTPTAIDLLLVPALSIDKKGIRLGYGGGFFDRLRSQAIWQNIPALVILPQICVSSNLLPKDNWDIPFDGWISELGITKSQIPSNEKLKRLLSINID
ncbi:5-formyltetrahydrofolate cyclo-ligase [Prochlorococcus sp. MIT 1300]|uniref:5-formyltetrahydrofolate cyclo-ligase n=1 Tax=Prochlorococcus sp. MIT 1300 TaxID=3096218 RepID=UPI002A74792F|nr:5-formyltetrahydrofolate cyclo-ligase [Prochlorococcus sp. MIT 1300]